MSVMNINNAGSVRRTERPEYVKVKNADIKARDRTEQDKIDIDSLKMSLEEQKLSIRNMVKDLVEKQGFKFNSSTLRFSDGEIYNEKSENIRVDKATSLKAQSEISDEGFWGVKKTSERIVDFAKKISGGDISKLEILKDAIREGFEAAKELMGGKLPDISEQTYEAVMKSLDEWNTSENK